MTAQIIDNETGRDIVTAEALEGVRTARVIAFLIDYLIIGVLTLPAAFIVGVLGIVTLGFAWGIYPFLIPLVAVLYLAFTMGGPSQATIGMRFMGVRVFKIGGGRVDPVIAGLHGILFWFIQGFAVFLPLIVSFFSSKKRLLHDIALGTYVARDVT